MVNNYREVLASLVSFLKENSPPGAERDLARLREDDTWISLSFRLGNADCSLYVRTEDTWSDNRLDDEAGNRYSSHRIACQVSWPSWGADGLAKTQERLALMTEVTRFAVAVEAAFPHVFHLLLSTKEERDAQEIVAGEKRAKDRIVALIKKNARGLKVGAERRVEKAAEEAEFVPMGVLEVEDTYNGRHFKYCATVTATHAFYFTRVG